MRRTVVVAIVTALCLRGHVAAQGPGDLPTQVELAKPGVVTIVAFQTEKAMPSLSAGFFVAADRVVSARHVFAGIERAEVRTSGGQTVGVSGVLAEDRVRDLVLVQLAAAADGARPLPVCPTLPREGETVFTIGCPLGLEWTTSVGIVSAIREIPECGLAVQHTVPVSAGSSGGPLLNLRGEVVGVQSAMITAKSKIVQAGQNLNFAVPASRIAALELGELRPLRDCLQDVPAGWTAPLVEGVDVSGLRFLVRDDFRAATRFFRESVERTPDEPDAWFRLGLCYERSGDHDRALEAYQRVIVLQPDHKVAHNNLGIVYGRRGELDQAVAALRRAVQCDETYALAHCNLADAYLRLGRHGEAVAAAARAVELDEKVTAAYEYLGQAYAHLGAYDKAEEQCRALEDIDRGRAGRLREFVKQREAAAPGGD